MRTRIKAAELPTYVTPAERKQAIATAKGKSPRNVRLTWWRDAGLVYAEHNTPCSSRTVFSKGHYHGQD
jgi:hypothetical protein